MATASQFLAAAAKEIGYTETPPGSNKTKFAKAAGHANGFAWCATFCVAIAKKVGLSIPNSASTVFMSEAFRKQGRLSLEPSRGALAFFDFPDKKRRIQHVGIVESWTATTVTCIEGNTSSSAKGSQDNGGGVFRRTRPRAHVVNYGVPAFDLEAPPTLPTDVVDELWGGAAGALSGWQLQRDGGVITFGNAPFYGSYPGLPAKARVGKREFGTIEPYKGGYVLISTAGERYHFPKP